MGMVKRKIRKAKPSRRKTPIPRGTRRPRASAKDILAPLSRPVRVPPKWQSHYEQLLRLREQVLRRQGALVKDAREEQQAFSLHMADAATDEFDRDFALTMISSGQGSLYEIDQALNRIRNGTYGLCEITGKPIEPGRLKAIPWTRFSAEAEKQLEKRERIAKVTPPEAQAGEEEEGEE
jgi:DnaK suppressor protein